MAGLTVMIDYVAALREAMQSTTPEPVAAAILAETAGADGIGVYLREDHRPVQPRDVKLLREALNCRLVLHMAPLSEMIGLALEVKPERVVLMPALREDGAVENGLDMVVGHKTIFETVDTLQSHGISVGISILPEPEQVKVVHQTRANWVQFHAGRFSSAKTATSQTSELNKIVDCMKMANRLRLHVAVGHGIDYRNIKLFADMAEIDEFNIGKSLVARSVLVGMDRAVRDMVALIRSL